MTFHEKSRWVGLIANLALWGWYFALVIAALRGGAPDEPTLLGAIIAVIFGSAVIHIVSLGVIAALRPSEARTELDERERAIADRAGARAYDLLCLALVVAIGASLWHWNSFIAVNAVMFAFIVAECARYVIEIVAYRRGAA